MERDFRYLRDQHGDAGAREIFEKICTQLLQMRFGENAHNIRVSRGDEGIDILVGDFQSPIANYQCKYFINGIDNSQKTQIKNSFDRAIHSKNYSMNKWTLCVPCTLSSSEFKWWSEWSGQQKRIYHIEISLFDGSYLISELKKNKIYDETFDEDIRINLDKILEYMKCEKARHTEETITKVTDIFQEDCNTVLLRKQAEFLNEPIYGNPNHTLKNLFVEYQIEYRYKDCKKIYNSCWNFFDHYQYFGDSRLLLMLGDYGAGKSSTLKLLSSRYQTCQYIYISLRDILLFSSNIRDGIIDYCHRKYKYSDLFSHSKKHILLLDGFDELQQIMDELNEAKYFRQIVSLLDYENVSIVLSSRGTRFVHSINITLYPQVYLSDFKEEQINIWIEKWKIINDTKSIISLEGIKERDLLHVASNKLILYMIARIYDEELVEARQYTRGYIYKLFIDWTISGKFKDDQAQHIVPNLKDRERYRKILQEIAYVMTIRGKEIITYEELSTALNLFQKTELQAVLYDVNVQIFTQHFFTISHDDYNCISFSHKSFRQYLLAEKLWKIWEHLGTGTEDYGVWYQFGKYGQLEKESFDFLNDSFGEETDVKKLQKINQLALRRCALFVNCDQYTKLLLENQNSKVLEAAECYSRSIILSTIAGIVNILSANRLSVLGKKYHQISAENIFMLCDYYLRGKNAYYIRNYDVMTQFIKQIRVKDINVFRMRYYSMDLRLFEICDSSCAGGLFYTFHSHCTKLVNVHWEFSKLTDCIIANGSMECVSFEHCKLEDVTFENIVFDNVVFVLTENINVIFRNCKFVDCYFRNCAVKDNIISKDLKNIELDLFALDNLFAPPLSPI